ncbi:hypothetical protein F9C07_1954468 [Aspergillus flavus]|uniref:Uncharacterized protein n=1 Tax=Aspergillus flavus (strain ATCC 200026 / FGSC A1120 / IAM 13836 / NRRL 3357 / JCM 12722 / SRRC 167) TaxID=332952 RepID=A0A7G5KJM9_ASPFN|nr:uncharacterized protein G4B84_011539 [Aspergillus flavus NRRL3357]QMW36010.1 hypothetical protein G4B84_011539 [Aspergillus flavus NRRL3357]QMW48071.1 hypothetical protein G4B11_011589 [Aspergillus flavus]QRD93036.1 hypothetical protein F9C07_1954468 [Aspergillus flavus]RAQ77137.1 hypothetical protein COH20_007484 [Aspergillus flavus]
MPLEVLRMYPVRPDLLLPEELPNLDFRDYDPPADAQADDNEYWNTGLCTEMLAEYFKSYILGGFPRRLPPNTCSLADMRQLNWISVPHPFLLGAGLDCYYPRSRNSWSAGPILEPKSSGDHVYSHTTLVVTQDCEGSNDSMLFGELAPIICSMYNRARQPQVPNEDQESMFDAPGKIAQYDLQFPEVHFPVMLISFVDPQHGRIFCGYMNGGELIIHQSKLYSFERKESAPFDLFASFALSQPAHSTT